MRKILLIILSVTMVFVTACGSWEDTISDKTSSMKLQESEAPSSGTIENQSSATSRSSVTSVAAVPGSTSADVSSTAASDQESDNSSDASAEMPGISSTVTVSYYDPEQSAGKEENALSIEITVNGRTFSATLYDNETARAFSERLPLAVNMSELNGNEKYYYLPDNLPTNSGRPSRINMGDIMLYGNSCLVIFYESFSTSYSYTLIGKIDDPAGLASALGSGGVQVSFNAAPHHRR